MARSKASYQNAARHTYSESLGWPMWPVARFTEGALSSVQVADQLIVDLLHQREAHRLQEQAEKEQARLDANKAQRDRYYRKKAEVKTIEYEEEDMELEEVMA